MSNNSEKLIKELRNRMKSDAILPDEPEFFNSDETLLRFLKAREWNVKDAEKQLRSTVEWRRKTRPLMMDCTFCHKRPGLHSLRQVGFDEAGRPVIYSSFSQANSTKNSVEESIAHVTYLIENAQKSMAAGISTFVLVIDCSGVTVQACNPKLGYEVTQVLSNFYPERLGQVFCVNHSPLFQGVWNAIKVFLHPNTARKVKLLKKKLAMEQFQKMFNAELTDWLAEEMQLNKLRNITEKQRTFWLPNESHDPRATPSYLKRFCSDKQAFLDQVNGNETTKDHSQHLPHPNIIDALTGLLSKDESVRIVRNSSMSLMNSSGNSHSQKKNHSKDDVKIDEWENLDDDIMLEIPVEFQIEAAAKPIQ